MKQIVGKLYSVRGYPNSTAFTDFKTDLFSNGNTPAIVMNTATTTGVTISAATTNGILITGNSTDAIKILTGIFTRGINLGGTLTTGIYINSTSVAAIDIGACAGRAIRVGTKGTSYANSTALPISSIGGVLDTDPAKNYMVGVFTKVSASETSTSTDDLASAWFRTRVDVGITIGAGYSLSGMKSQLRIYSTSGSATSISNWAAAGLLGILEVSGATTTFQSGCVAAAVYANVSLTTTSVIASGAVVAGVAAISASAAITDTGTSYFGVYVGKSGAVAFDAGLNIAASSSTIGIIIGTSTTGINLTGTFTTHLYSSTAMVVDMPVTAPGVGFDTAGGIKYLPYGKRGSSGMFVEEIYINLNTAAVSSKNTDLDIIGEAAGGAAYIGQITAAFNGTVVGITMTCLEVPATGTPDIDLYTASVNSGVYDGAVSSLTNYAALITSGGNWTLGLTKAASALPTANYYLYLTSGDTAAAGAYSTGKFLIRIYGI